MIVIPPITISTSMLTSNIPEPDTSKEEITWVPGTTYIVGDLRILTSTHRVYLRLTPGAGTITPDLDTLNWSDVGPTNRWAMFDILRSTKSTLDAGTITVVITPNQIFNSIAIMQLTAIEVSISISSTIGGGVVYSNTLKLLNRKTTSFYNYFFNDLTYRTNTAVFDTPYYSDAVVTITINNGINPVFCGGIVLGKYEKLGYTQLGCTSQALNFSTITRDTFGNAQVVQRRSVPKTSQTVLFKATDINRLETLRDQLNAIPAVWSGIDDQTEDDYFDSFLIMGIYRDFTIKSDNILASLNLELEEV